MAVLQHVRGTRDEADRRKTNSQQNLCQEMAESSTCLGHTEREDRENKIGKLATRSKETPDENLRVLTK